VALRRWPCARLASERSQKEIATPAEETTSTLLQRTNRRNFIVWYLGGLMGAIGLAGLAPLLLYIVPGAGANKFLDLSVTLDKGLDQLQDGQGVSFDAPAGKGFVMADGGGDNQPGKIAFKGFAIKAGGNVTLLSATCSHLGCSVSLNEGKGFNCPCHGSVFGLSGAVKRGPATSPLSHYTWKKGAKPNEIIVHGVDLPGVG